ncbi:MAG: threonine-phosphate decarboxylase CobD [Cyanobacteria bacterium P01_D01_bin.14]
MGIRPVHGGNLAWATQIANCPPSELLDFSASISPLGPPASVLAAIQSQIPQLAHYPDPDYRLLRVAIGQHHNISPDWVLPGNGAAELLTWASRDFSSLAGCGCLTPAFSDYVRALGSYGVAFNPMPLLIEGAWDFHRWQASINQLPRASGILVNNPHNPSGYLWSQSALLDCLEHLALVVVDEAFMDFLPPARQQSVSGWVEQYDNLVVLRSQTKFYSIPGIRIGYAIAHPDRLRRWQSWRDPWSVNTLAAAAAIAALQDTDFQTQTWQWLAVARAELFEALNNLPGLAPLPGEANFLLVRCERSVTALQQRLLQHHRIYIRDCLSFAELGDRYFRVAVRHQTENQRLVTALAACLRG